MKDWEKEMVKETVKEKERDWEWELVKERMKD